MKRNIVAKAVLLLIVTSAILTITPNASAATATFGQTVQSGSTSTALNTALGARYTNTIPSQADSISAFIGFSSSAGYFGQQTEGSLSSASIDNRMRGQAFTSPAYPVVATSVSARIAAGMTHNVKAAIYTSSGSLVASSNAISVPGLSTSDRTFTLTSNPVLSASTTYILVVWAQDQTADAALAYNNGGNGRVSSVSISYGAWPTTVSFVSQTDRNYFIWCNYQSAANVQCAIYSADGATRLGVTEQKTLTSSTSGWTTFNFNTKPTLSATDYVVAAWSNNPAVNIYYTGTTAQAFTGSGASVPASLSASGTRNYNLQASITYNTITASAGTGGSISPSGSVNVAPGLSQSFTITPNAGYHITDVIIDGTSSAGTVTSYNFPSVTSDRSITANFAINTYTITVTQGLHGTISPATTTANYGETKSFTITPDIGYQIVDVVVDGGSVGAVSSYDFTNVDAPHEITATYAITPVATALTVICTPDTVDKTASLNTVVSGTLAAGGLPVSGQKITLTYNGGDSIGEATTQADGSYSLPWTVPSTLANGFYAVNAEFVGDNNPYLSSNAVTTNNAGGGGLFVVPEYTLGALAALGVCLAGFAIVKTRRPCLHQ